MMEVMPALDPNRFEVLGSDMQVLNLKMSGSETMQSVPGAMMYMEPSVTMAVNCNDMLGRCLSGSSCIMADYTNTANAPAVLGLTPNFPAKIIPLPIAPGNVYRCKDGAYFASTGSVAIGYDIDCNPATCCCGGQGCVRQTVSGDGTAYLAAMGTLMQRTLDAGETIVVDTNSVVAWSETVSMDVRKAGGFCTCCCGGEGMFNTTLTGPGLVYFQSMSFAKFKSALSLAVQANAQRSESVTFAQMGAPPEGTEMTR